MISKIVFPLFIAAALAKTSLDLFGPQDLLSAITQPAYTLTGGNPQ
jgi:hypothetical protein